MKSTSKNKNQLIVTLIFYLIASSNLMHINKTINSNLNISHKNKLNEKNLSKNQKLKYISILTTSSTTTKTKNFNNNQTAKRFPFSNPLGNLIGGLVEQLAYGENRFYECFPKSWLNGDQMDKEGEGHASKISGNLTKWVDGLSAFISLAVPIIQFFCKFKAKIIKFIQGHIIKRKLKKFRLMLESGNRAQAMKYMGKKYGWSLGNKIKNGLKKAENWAENKAKDVGKFLKENILDPVFNKWFLPIKNKVLSLVQKIMDFFSSDFITKIQDCVDRLSEIKGKFEIIFQALKKKFNSLRSSISMGYPALIVFAADFIVALTCEYQFLVEGITFIAKGADAKEDNERNYGLGKGIGVLFRTFATAPTVAEKINKSKKFKKLYFR